MLYLSVIAPRSASDSALKLQYDIFSLVPLRAEGTVMYINMYVRSEIQVRFLQEVLIETIKYFAKTSTMMDDHKLKKIREALWKIT